MKKIRAKLKTPWLEAFLALISAVIGLFAGKFLEAIVPLSLHTLNPKPN